MWRIAGGRLLVRDESPEEIANRQGIPIRHLADRVADFGQAGAAPVFPRPPHRGRQAATWPEEIPEDARARLEFIWLERVEDAVAAALEPAPPVDEAAMSTFSGPGD